MCMTSSNAPVKPINGPASMDAGPNTGFTLPAAGGLGAVLLPDAAAMASAAPGCGSCATAPQRCTLVGEGCKETTPEYGLLGRMQLAGHSPKAYLNTHDPFCFVTLGVQGSGKSHSLSVILESCVLRADDDALRLRRPMCALVFHFDHNQRSGCEAIGVINPSDRFRTAHIDPPTLPPEKMLVLVSPSNYEQRKAFYGPDVRVEPLLFSWGQLSAKQLKCLMRINAGDSQLYVSTMLSQLRGFQRKQHIPAFDDFCAQIEQTCSSGSQNGPLRQRLALLEALVKESAVNQELRAVGGGDLSSLMQEEGMLVVADLTDPLLSAEEANGIFEVLLDQAHRYVSGTDTDGLSRGIVDAVRLMRHEGLRVAISTQSPKVLAPELLELVSLLLVHRFHSEDWFTYLKSKVPLPAGGFETIRGLATGQALVFAASHDQARILKSTLYCDFLL
jgi:hypothetical protein